MVGLMLLVIVGNMKEAAAATEGVFDYEIIGDGKAEITGYNGTDSEVVIPETIGGLEVVRIGNEAFSGKSLTNVTIPNSVTSIENYAFEGNYLKSVTIPEGVTRIGDHAFAYNELESLTIPDSVTEIGINAFMMNGLQQVTIPDNVKEIAVNAGIHLTHQRRNKIDPPVWLVSNRFRFLLCP
jgi:hypothetical protein